MARRWNGWGDESARLPVPKPAADLVRERIGGSHPRPDADLATVIAAVPGSRLSPHPLVATDPAERVRVARGQGFPDLVALRTGRIPAFPDGVAHPVSREEVRGLLSYARDSGAHVIPYGGGTSVAGQVITLGGDAPTLVVSLQRMTRLRSFDAQDRLATFGAGIPGPVLEAQLRARGHTLGHFPQSFELSTLGGWVATRSRGQQSLGYGRIEDLFAGGHLEAPAGTLDLPAHPASSTGPDPREWILGSEGRLGILTEVTVRVRSLPQREAFQAFAFRDFERAQACVRDLTASDAPLSMLRLATPAETEISLAAAGRGRGSAVIDAFLALRGVRRGITALLVVALTGGREAVRGGEREVRAGVRRHDGTALPGVGPAWPRSRFRGPYLRDALWDLGYGVDTVETATSWSGHAALRLALEDALHRALAREDERVFAFSHLSHAYPTGANLYTTFLFRLGADPDQTLARWRALKDAACRAIVAQGATISHQHGVGIDHRAYLENEKGPLALSGLRRLGDAFDPARMLNPGKLFEDRS
jgi:alkyldihydroxyacetonephosphate synthase